MMRSRLQQYGVAGILAAIFVAPLSLPAATAQQAGKGGTNYGNISIGPYYKIHSVTSRATGAITIDLEGRSKPVVITSPDYEIAAPNIQLILQKPASDPKAPNQKSRYKATRSIATGGVRVVVREPAQQQTTVLTCNQATYTATTNPKDKGQIVLNGNVRSVTQGPGLEEPLISENESGVVKFLPNGDLSIELTEGRIQGTPKEPAPRKQQ